MHEYETKLLSLIKDKKEVQMEALEKSLDISRDSILWAIENLAVEKAITVTKEKVQGVMVSDEGVSYLDEFPEEKLVRRLAGSGKEEVSSVKNQVAMSWCKRNGWIKIDSGKITLTDEGAKAAKGAAYKARDVLNMLKKAKPQEIGGIVSKNKEVVEALSKRGLVELKERSVIRSIAITQEGAKMLAGAAKEPGVGQLSKEMIASGDWKKQGFKPYNINAPTEKAYAARMHPIREFINFVRQKWLEMGFIEVSGPIVESAFWNFDALFSPQDHPTREMQDTFFLENPNQINIEDLEAFERVRKMHISGWGEQWRTELAKAAILRTHTTSVSAHYMRKLASSVNASFPLKLFSIGSVFRNESIDYKHVAELHQVDGIIVGENLTLANLIDSLKKFYLKLGLDNVRFRPSYFPFTEPSLEAYYYDEEHGDSIELLGGGIIRKEITKALGIDKTVLAWGGGIERPMLSSRIFGLDSIVTPYKNNIGWLRSRGNLKV